MIIIAFEDGIFPLSTKSLHKNGLKKKKKKSKKKLI